MASIWSPYGDLCEKAAGGEAIVIARHFNPESQSPFLSGLEVKRFSLSPGLVAEVRRPTSWADRSFLQPQIGAEAEHEAFVVRSAEFAADAFVWRFGPSFAEGRVETAVKHIQDSVYFSIFDESKGELLGSIRLMNHPYAVRNGVIVASGKYKGAYFPQSPDQFRKSEEFKSGQMPLPKLKMSMEDYLGIEIMRAQSALIELSKKNPDVTYHRIFREVGNFRVNSKLPPARRAEVWAELWSFITREIITPTAFSPQMDEPLFTYGDDESEVLYRGPGFRVQDQYGTTVKDNVPWRVLLSDTDKLLAYNHYLLLKGRNILPPKRFVEIRRAESYVIDEHGFDPAYAFLQTPEAIFEDFLTKSAVSLDFELAKHAMRNRAAWFANRSRKGQQLLDTQIQRFLEVVQSALSGPSREARHQASYLLFRIKQLDRGQAFLESPELLESFRALVRQELSPPPLKEGEFSDLLLPMDIEHFLSVLILKDESDIDLVLELARSYWKSRQYSPRYEFESLVRSLGESLYRRFIRFPDKEAARKIVEKLAPFGRDLMRLPEESCSYAEGLVPGEVLDRLLGWASALSLGLLGEFPSVQVEAPKEEAFHDKSEVLE